MAAPMHAVAPPAPTEAEAPTPAAPLALRASFGCAAAGLIALVIAITALWGWPWALLALVPFLFYAAYLLAPDN